MKSKSAWEQMIDGARRSEGKGKGCQRQKKDPKWPHHRDIGLAPVAITLRTRTWQSQYSSGHPRQVSSPSIPDLVTWGARKVTAQPWAVKPPSSFGGDYRRRFFVKHPEGIRGMSESGTWSPALTKSLATKGGGRRSVEIHNGGPKNASRAAAREGQKRPQVASLCRDISSVPATRAFLAPKPCGLRTPLAIAVRHPAPIPNSVTWGKEQSNNTTEACQAPSGFGLDNRIRIFSAIRPALAGASDGATSPVTRPPRRQTR
jgi:hypothetical protein